MVEGGGSAEVQREGRSRLAARGEWISQAARSGEGGEENAGDARVLGSAARNISNQIPYLVSGFSLLPAI